jgi:DNA-binding transcriptional MerR regulator
MLIGELAEKANVSIDTIRYYEREGLIEPVSVRESGYREFDKRSVKTIGFVVRAKDLGFSLKEIRNLLALKDNPDTTCSSVRAMAKKKLEDVTGKIKALRKIETELKTLVKECAGGDAGLDTCPIVDSLEKDSG